MKKTTKIIFRFVKPHKWMFLLLFFCVIITTFTGSVFPYLFGKMVDEVFYAKNMSAFISIVILYGVIYLFNQLMHFTLNMSWANLMTRFLFDIRKAIFNKVLSSKGKDLSDMHTGDIIERMGGDAEQFMNFIHWNVFYTTAGVLNLILSIGYIAYISQPLAALTIIMTPVSVYISRAFAKKGKLFYKQIADSSGLLSSWLFEMIKGMQEIRLLGAAQNILCDFTGKTIKIMRLQIKANRIEVLSDRVNSGISLVGQMLLYVISAVLICAGHITVGGFVACVSYFGTCAAVFNSLNNKAAGIASNMVSIERVQKVLETDCEEYNDNQPPFVINRGGIIFDSVVFSYNDQIRVLDGVSLEIKPGEKVSLVGRSGEGKSTAANLICRLYEPQSGRILIDGKNIADCNLHSLRSQIGIVHQETILFEGSIRYNLTFSNDKSSDDKIWNALEMAHLSEYIQSLPKGLDTVIGTAESSLSGGQKQRLAIARLFLKNPKILIFDEATSSLDSEAEQAVKEAWDQLCKGRTILIIAHRLSTIISSDRVAVLSGGRISGFGTHRELLQSCAPYIELFKKQYSLTREEAARV